MSLTVRPATDADVDAFLRQDERGFGVTHTPDWAESMRRMLPMDRFLLAEVAGEIVGVTGSFPFPLGVPGGQVRIEGVTAVSVLPTHRRRGVLRALMHAQLERFARSGLALAALTASHAGIYGRFGYGAATEQRRVRIDRRTATFRPELPDPGGVRMVSVDEARPHAIEAERRWAAVTPGSVLRHEAVWDMVLADPEHRRGGHTAAFHLLHADGYASYRMDHERKVLLVQDVFAATPEAHHALWRVLLGNDIVDTVETWSCPPGDPLPFLLVDPRLVETTSLRDAVWIRIVDPVAALGARRYATELDAVLEIHDPVLTEKTRVRIVGGPDGAHAVASSEQPDVTLGTAALGSLYLGGHRAGALARAGLIEGDPQVVRRIDTAFGADREPHHGTGF